MLRFCAHSSNTQQTIRLHDPVKPWAAYCKRYMRINLIYPSTQTNMAGVSPLVQQPPYYYDTKTRFLLLPTTILLSACSTQVSTVNDYHCGMKVVNLFYFILLPPPTSKAKQISIGSSVLPIITHSSPLGGTLVFSNPQRGGAIFSKN